MQRANWSNLPITMVPRGGLEWGDLTTTQREALLALLRTVLSEDGVEMVLNQMAADEWLKQNTSGGGGTPPQGGTAPNGAAPGENGGPTPENGGPNNGTGPGPGGLEFGEDLYYISFLGEPSSTQAWMIQFGGHHLAINATIVGPDMTLSPSMTGGQPLQFEWDGEPVYIVGDEVNAAQNLIDSLNADQLGQAVLGNSRINLILGPGNDGKTLAPEGLQASNMSEAQQTLLLELIETRIGIMNDDDAAAAMANIASEIDETYFAWFGAVDAADSAYWRVTAPSTILEYSPQNMGGDLTQHTHNMIRSPSNDYGVSWVAEVE